MLGSASLMSAHDAKGATAPEAPSGVDASQDSSTSALITWDDNSNREDNHVIYRQVDGGGFSQHDTVGADVESYSDTGLTKGSTYDYKIAAKNEAGESAQAGPASVTIEDVPAQATNFTATAVSDTQINLSWTDNATNEDEYKVQEKVGGSWGTIKTLPADSTSYSVTGLTEGTTHEYRVQACNSLAGCSTSTSASGSATTQLATPTDFNALDEGSYSHLRWTDNSDKEQGYEVYRDGSLYDTIAAGSVSYYVSCPDAEANFKVRAIHSSIPASSFSESDTGVFDCSGTRV